jgi:hypothetical protein
MAEVGWLDQPNRIASPTWTTVQVTLFDSDIAQVSLVIPICGGEGRKGRALRLFADLVVKCFC